MNYQLEAIAFVERNRDRVREQFENGQDYDARMVRLSTVYTREDVALLCFLANQMLTLLQTFYWLVGWFMAATILLLGVGLWHRW